MKNIIKLLFKIGLPIILLFIMSACGGGGGGEGTTSGSSSTVSSTPVINTGSSGLLTGTITIAWTYPLGTDVEGFRLYVYDDAQLQTQTFAPKPSDGPTDFDVSFDGTELGNDGAESFYFVVEAYRGSETARSAAVCFTGDGGMNSCQ